MFLVGEEGVEPSCAKGTDFKSAVYTSSTTRPIGGAYEIRTRVIGFADPCLTPRPTRQNTKLLYLLEVIKVY